MKTRLISAARLAACLAVMAATVAGSLATPASAQALSQLSCKALWYQRNAIYAQQGYCFKTADAIATFGQGCFPPYGQLTSSQQRQVAEIRAWESRRGCN